MAANDMDSQNVIYYSNILILATLAVVCRALSTSQGHSRSYYSTISGNYMLYPERWLFQFGIYAFVIVHAIQGGATIRLISNGFISNTLVFMEIVELVSLVIIASVPVQKILGLHALLGFFLFGSSLIWMIGLGIATTTSTYTLILTRLCIILTALSCIYNMVSSLPFDVIEELSRAQGDEMKKLQLLGHDKRWNRFAVYEWLYFFCMIAFLLCT